MAVKLHSRPTLSPLGQLAAQRLRGPVRGARTVTPRTGPDPRAGHLAVSSPRSEGGHKSRVAGHSESLTCSPDAAPGQTATLQTGARQRALCTGRWQACGPPARAAPQQAALSGCPFLNTGVWLCFSENVTFAKRNSVKKFLFRSNTTQASTVGHRARGSHSCPGQQSRASSSNVWGRCPGAWGQAQQEAQSVPKRGI